MEENKSRREFIKTTSIAGMGFGFSPKNLYGVFENIAGDKEKNTSVPPLFIPYRAASWWCTIEDLQWPQQKITDKIRRRAERFAEAKIETAINFGFLLRFDFSNYFGQLHGYYASVCDELHKYGIKFMDHYSCNEVERPRGKAELQQMSKFQRHCVLLYHDPVAAEYAQYEGYSYNDICEVDLVDGGRGYARQYQFETFCHNNPHFLDMHRKYLQRLKREVPFDGIEVDDMCNYTGNTACGCKFCRERFKKEYGHVIPPLNEKFFWGDTSKPMLEWGNYENPVFRDWLRMKTDIIVDHVKMIKNTIGDKPLMTCCSNTGPVVLNALSLDLEKLSPHLDFFMLENVGINIHNVDWVEMDAEALHQKDIAQKRSNAPAMALSYTIYKKGAYFGWALSRFWGVCNWSSTLNGRLEEDPEDAMEMEDVIRQPDNWEVGNSNLDYRTGRDLVEVRLVSNRYCRENGWRDEKGREHWDRIKAWSVQLVKHNVGYRFVRSAELADPRTLSAENTPLIIDGAGCISEKQFSAVKTFLSAGGIVWLSLPFGTHDENGVKRLKDLSAELLKARYKNLRILDSAIDSQPLQKLINEGHFKPVIKQLKGGAGWAARIRIHENETVIHFLNTALVPVPHPSVKDTSGIPVLKDIESQIRDNDLEYEINTGKILLQESVLLSPETGNTQNPVSISSRKNGHFVLGVNLEGIKVYAVVQPIK